MDGLLALDLLDKVIEFLRSTNDNVQPKHTSKQETDALHSKTKTQRVKRRQKVDQFQKELESVGELPEVGSQIANRTPTHTACTDAQIVSAHHTAQSDHFSSREQAWLKFKDLCVENILSSTRHVSFLAVLDSDHQHKFSFTNLSNPTLNSSSGQ